MNARYAAATIIALLACVGLSQAQNAVRQPAPEPAVAATADGLGDLASMTFGCPKAGLNAAATEAAKVQSQGTYQFAYFKIINDAHHAAYEVHFKSNYEGEPDLNYCVSIYCQQGWDPKTTKTTVTLMPNERRRPGAAAHAAACGHEPPPANRRTRR